MLLIRMIIMNMIMVIMKIWFSVNNQMNICSDDVDVIMMKIWINVI